MKNKSAVRVTSSSDFEGWPAYSPNGSEVAYSEGHNEISPVHIFITDSQFKSKRQLTDGNFYDSAPSFSKDGQKILFCRASRLRPYSMGGKTWDDWDIYSINIDGGNLTRLTAAKFRRVDPPYFLGDKRAIYAGELHTKGSENRLYFLDFGMTNKLIPVEAGAGATYASGDPNVSGKAGKIVFISNRVTRVGIYDYELWVATTEGKDIRKVTNLHSLIENPFFGPDGKQIFFLSDPDRAENYDLMRCNIDGSNLVKIYSGIR